MTERLPKTVRDWIADAEAVHGPSLDEWFPAAFDWRAFCADAPALAERLGGRWAGSTAAAGKARLEELAQAAFRGAYVAALAVLAAYDAEEEPDDALLRLTAPLSDAEEEGLVDALADEVAAVERGLAGEAGDPADPRVVAALVAARAIREAVRIVLADGLQSSARAVVSLGGSVSAVAKVAAGVVNVGVALAALRYAIAAEVDEAEGRRPLLLDRVALGSTLGTLVDGEAAEDGP
jgi:hypothetical protein